VLRVGELASRIGASLVLYNNVEYFVASPSLSFSETFVFDRQIKNDVSERKKNLQKLAGKIEKRFGIEVKTVVDAEDFTAAEGILKKSKKTPSSMIAMLSQTGPVLSNLVGSTTRRVIRRSEEPVFVLK
jgi:nucleotide-binding universal stress UspA family protein